MARKEPTVSWQVLLDENQWEKDAPAPVMESEQPQRRHWPTIPRRWLFVAGFLLVTAGITTALFLWQQAQRGLALMQQEIEKAALVEATAHTSKSSLLAERLFDPSADGEWRARVVDGLMADASLPAIPAVENIEWLDGVALVHLTLTDPDLPQPSRVVRFYREDSAGWLRTSPVASAWGAADVWEGEHFVFRFQEWDRAAVLAAAPQVEAVYIQLRHHLGLPILSTRRIVVVWPDDRPLEFDFPSRELRQPSPQLLVLPTGISHESALFRSLTLYLINELVRESFDRYAYGQAWMWSKLTESALRSWLQLESGALDTSSTALIPWLLDTAPQTGRMLPAGVAEECQLMEGLGARMLILPCTPGIELSRPNPSSVLDLNRLATTYDFDFTRDANATDTPSGPMWREETRREIVAATTIFLYATETYGVENLPTFLEALGDHRDWTGVLPVAYDLSVEAFEAGWRGWLAGKFGIGD